MTNYMILIQNYKQKLMSDSKEEVVLQKVALSGDITSCFDIVYLHAQVCVKMVIYFEWKPKYV
jgi:hypothetical protein